MGMSRPFEEVAAIAMENNKNRTGVEAHASAFQPAILLVGLESLDRTHWLHHCRFEGKSTERMVCLKEWHKKSLGIAHRAGMHLLCRRYFVGIGTLSVRTSAVARSRTVADMCRRSLRKSLMPTSSMRRSSRR